MFQLQTLLLKTDTAENDLPEGDSGVDGRSVKRKARAPAGGDNRRRKAGHLSCQDHERTQGEADNFMAEAIICKVT
eukprot:2654846-Pleurochrysis_carterae.AAC.2